MKQDGPDSIVQAIRATMTVAPIKTVTPSCATSVEAALLVVVAAGDVPVVDVPVVVPVPVVLERTSDAKAEITP